MSFERLVMQHVDRGVLNAFFIIQALQQRQQRQQEIQQQRQQQTQIQTLQQIQEEIEREAKIDKRIENSVKRFLKRNRQFKRVEQREDCDGIIIFYRDDLSKYNMILNGEENTFLDDPDFCDRLTLVFVKNKNKHDNKLHTYSFLRKHAPHKNDLGMCD